MPILHSFGVMIPGQLGPINLELLLFKNFLTFEHVQDWYSFSYNKQLIPF
jgi:hypothetical protein